MFGEKFEGDVERSPLKKKKDLYWWKWRQEASLMTSHLYFCQTSDKKLMLSNLKYFSRFATFVKFATLQGVLVWVHFKTNSLFSSNSPLNRGRVSLISHSEFSSTLWQMFAKCPIFARFAILSNLPFSSIIEATGRLLTSHSNFHQSSSSPLRAFLSYFKTLSSGPTLEIEPMAYCWFTRDVTAPNVGDQEQKCRSLLRTKKVLLITNVSTLSHDCKLSVRTCA